MTRPSRQTRRGVISRPVGLDGPPGTLEGVGRTSTPESLSDTDSPVYYWVVRSLFVCDSTFAVDTGDSLPLLRSNRRLFRPYRGRVCPSPVTRHGHGSPIRDTPGRGVPAPKSPREVGLQDREGSGYPGPSGREEVGVGSIVTARTGDPWTWMFRSGCPTCVEEENPGRRRGDPRSPKSCCRTTGDGWWGRLCVSTRVDSRVE